jgi:hypothetical protein
MTHKTVTSIEIVEEGEARFVVSTYADGSVVRKPVNKNARAARRPRRPPMKLGSERMDFTPRKRI